MKILAISDVPSKALWDYNTREKLEGIDLILSCGDLPKKYLEYLTNFTAVPILYVHGNHDGSYRGDEPGGCICVDDQVFVWKGLRIMGLGGCFRYNQEDTYQYTEAAMRHRARKLWLQAHKVGGIDILLTHAPASGLNDGNNGASRHKTKRFCRSSAEAFCACFVCAPSCGARHPERRKITGPVCRRPC